MKYGFLNLLNAAVFSPTRHMTVNEIKDYNKEGKALPSDIVVHGDRQVEYEAWDEHGQEHHHVAKHYIQNINVGNSTLRIPRSHKNIILQDVTADKLISNHKGHYTGVFKSSIKEAVLNGYDVNLYDVNQLTDLTVNNFTGLVLENLPDLKNVKTNNDIRSLENASITNVPNFQLK